MIESNFKICVRERFSLCDKSIVVHTKCEQKAQVLAEGNKKKTTYSLNENRKKTTYKFTIVDIPASAVRLYFIIIHD